ncbi:D-glycerate dehydrogenase [Salibacterium salarium]|uniref:Glyoxylate/hydroxypyruvate reductase B n=1 Tax=Salibacterium salarium TaxID=284579 RepID=A0A428MV90_9BACI|nr:D-glycerate dehydrogenase [Salibacterium salarium]RSL30006.1 D-glycerate dehydrogenase [Salibacterium salarium]
MKDFKAVVIGELFPSPLEKLEESCDVRVWKERTPIPTDTLHEWLEDADGLISRGDVSVDEELVSAFPHLQVIAQSSVGYDNVDVQACTKKGIPFGNTPDVLVEATADLAFGLVLTSARKLHDGWDYVRNGQWNTSFDIPLGTDLYGKTLGIVGMGNIGRSVAKRAQASGMNIIYHNRKPSPKADDVGADYVAFDELLQDSDFIVVLVPLTSESKGLFGAEAFKKMKSTAHFINASRGPVVHTDDLYDALVNEDIAHAALDVTDPEPIRKDHPLTNLSNVIITPHIGSATYETRNSMSQLTVDNLLAGLQGKRLPACVNAAEVKQLS